MPKAIGVSERDYEFVKSQRKIKPDSPEEKESMIESLHNIISKYSEMTKDDNNKSSQ